MNNIFWLRDGILAGRSGPNRDCWDLQAIKAAGFSAILSVNNAEGVDQSTIDDLKMAYLNVPLPANIPPERDDGKHCLIGLPKALGFIQKYIASGPVLVHCRSGKDRTGMVLAAYLIQFEGYTVRQSIDAVLAVRPIAFSAEGWMALGLNVLQHFYKQHNK